ncbi:putative ferric-chelate reductase 1 homolog [Tubulanus polymorphus]|uniref:putative ferric-chelate reductase 1 homolog n=1 Tax=Tubulanus polymorphus TaxID=672921 RepID=UPI003DA3C686
MSGLGTALGLLYATLIVFHTNTNGLQFAPTPSTQIDTSTCGVSKGCFQVPAGCSFTNCDYLLTYQANGNNIVFELSSKVTSGTTEPYVAVGFSSDTKMGDDSVIGCLYVASSGQMNVYQSYNLGHTNIPITNTAFGLSSVEGGVKDGRITCRFSRQKTVVPHDPQVFDLTKPFYLMIARGAQSGGHLAMHSTSAGQLPVVSSEKIDLTALSKTGRSSGVSSEKLMKRAHAICMIIAWMLPAGLGIIIARYYKHSLNRQCLRRKLWFNLHRVCMVTVLCLTIVGIVTIVIAVGGFEMDEELPGRAHPILGIIVAILCILNPIMAQFRPHPDDERRPIFNWSHRIVGFTAHVFSMAAMLTGIQMGDFEIPNWTWMFVAVYIAVHFSAAIFLHVSKRIDEKNGNRRRRVSKEYSHDFVPLTEMNESIAGGVDDDAESEKRHRKIFDFSFDFIRQTLLLVYAIFVSALTLVLASYIAQG